jgi:hypothetical protein
MPRDISGNYTLPVGNPVVDGTIIDVGWANPTMADITVQLNNVLTLDGVLPATAPIKFATGSAAAPSITFNADPALGIYRGGTNILGFATAGVSRGTISATGNWDIPAPSSGVTLKTTSMDYPTYNIQAGSTSKYAAIQLSNSAGARKLELIYIGSAGTPVYGVAADGVGLNVSGANSFTLSTNDTARVVVAGTGGVSIAASSGTTLTVVGAATIPAFAFTISTGGIGQYLASVVGDSPGVSAPGSGLRLGWNSSTAGPTIRNYNGGDSNNAGMVFSVLLASAERIAMTLLQTGGVTIAAPSSGVCFTANALAAVPAAGFNNNAAARSYSTKVTDFATVHLEGNFANTTTAGIGFSSAGGGAGIGFSRGAGWDTSLEFYTNPSGTATADAATLRMAIASTGKTTFLGGVLTASSAVSFSATPNFDANVSNYFDLGALTANVTGATITNPTAGQTITIRAKQDATGSRTFVMSTASKITGSIQATLSTASLLTLTYNGTDSRWEGSWLALPV